MVVKIGLFIPTLNAGPQWSGVIGAIKSQQTFPDAVLVVDSGSMDQTTMLAKNAGFDVLQINSGDYNHGGTRQLALQHFIDYDVIVYMTQDAVLCDADSFYNIIKPFTDSQIAAVCGRQIPRRNAFSIERHSRFYNYKESSHVVAENDIERLGMKAAFLSNSFAAYRRESLCSVGGFPEKVIFGEDMYVAAKMLKAGWKIAYTAEACVYHSHNYSLIQEARRYFDMGVFHANEPWIRDEFGNAENEAIKFVRSELKYLWQHCFWRIPEALLRSLLKYAGFRLGLAEKYLPVKFKKKLSMNPGYFTTDKI